jgi:hypothetical protein
MAVGDNGADRLRMVPVSSNEAAVQLVDASGRDRIRLLSTTSPAT